MNWKEAMVLSLLVQSSTNLYKVGTLGRGSGNILLSEKKNKYDNSCHRLQRRIMKAYIHVFRERKKKKNRKKEMLWSSLGLQLSSYSLCVNLLILFTKIKILRKYYIINIFYIYRQSLVINWLQLKTTILFNIFLLEVNFDKSTIGLHLLLISFILQNFQKIKNQQLCHQYIV